MRMGAEGLEARLRKRPGRLHCSQTLARLASSRLEVVLDALSRQLILSLRPIGEQGFDRRPILHAMTWLDEVRDFVSNYVFR